MPADSGAPLLKYVCTPPLADSHPACCPPHGTTEPQARYLDQRHAVSDRARAAVAAHRDAHAPPHTHTYAYPALHTHTLPLALIRRRVIWTSATQSQTALGLRYQQIVMHAISRDAESAAPRPCIYLQLDAGSAGMQQGGDGDDEGEEEVEVEIWLIPEDVAKGELRA